MGIIFHLTIGQLVQAARGAGDRAITEHLRNCVQCQQAVADEARHGSHPAPDDLAALISGELADREKRSVDAHVATCRFCRAAVQAISTEPPKSAEPTGEEERLSPPAFFGAFTAVLIGGDVVRFVSETHQHHLLTAMRHQFQEQRALLADVVRRLDELEHSLGESSQLDVPSYNLVRSVPWVQETVAEQRQADSMLEEFRATVSRVMHKLEDGATLRVRPRRFDLPPPAIECHLGRTIDVQFAAAVAHEHIQLRVGARWRSGTPGRNIDVRTISRDPETIHSKRTDASGHAQFELDRRRYKVELEHEVHGAGGLIIDLSSL